MWSRVLSLPHVQSESSGQVSVQLMNCVIITSDSEILRYIPAGKKPDLLEMQSIVGGYIEYVRLPRGNGHASMIANEEGILEGLSYNPIASSIAEQHIVGDVLLMHHPDFKDMSLMNFTMLKNGIGRCSPPMAGAHDDRQVAETLDHMGVQRGD
jgi:hypothetical protein